MKIKEMKALTKHCDKYFEQSDCKVIHPIVDHGFHVDVLLYEPNQKYPFWKLVTMGASDYKMPEVPNTIGLFNEYIMFVDSDVDLNDKDVLNWYHSKLIMIASYAHYYQTHITYAHSFEWENEEPDDEMIAAFVEFPQVIEDIGILHCKVGLFKKVACLQVVLLNEHDLNQLKEIGPQAFSEYLYPDQDGGKHFLSERHRSEKF
ncbi:MAG: suppressor of fused domain protein [Roseburia sp.]|nr:suppressor of fused domain protein [Roseburia sp.]